MSHQILTPAATGAADGRGMQVRATSRQPASVNETAARLSIRRRHAKCAPREPRLHLSTLHALDLLRQWNVSI